MLRCEVIRATLTEVANILRDQGQLDESECYVDASLASAKGGDEQIGPIRRGKGVKIMAIVDRHGLPLAVTTHAANHHEVTLVQLTFETLPSVSRGIFGRTIPYRWGRGTSNVEPLTPPIWGGSNAYACSNLRGRPPSPSGRLALLSQRRFPARKETALGTAEELDS